MVDDGLVVMDGLTAARGGKHDCWSKVGMAEWFYLAGGISLMSRWIGECEEEVEGIWYHVEMELYI